MLSELHSNNPVVMGLKEQMKGIIPERALSSLPDRFDVIGDIAVLSLPEELNEYQRTIADSIISSRHNIRTVLNKISRVDGSNRTARYRILAGNDTVTIQKEYGFTYRLTLEVSEPIAPDTAENLYKPNPHSSRQQARPI